MVFSMDCSSWRTVCPMRWCRCRCPERGHRNSWNRKHRRNPTRRQRKSGRFWPDSRHTGRQTDLDVLDLLPRFVVRELPPPRSAICLTETRYIQLIRGERWEGDWISWAGLGQRKVVDSMGDCVRIEEYMPTCDNCYWHDGTMGVCRHPGGWYWDKRYHRCATFRRRSAGQDKGGEQGEK